MKIKKYLNFRLISLFTLLVFIFETAFMASPAYAESPCWNDGSITSTQGGSSTPAAASTGNPNPTGTEKKADPVNLATGNFYYEKVDLVIPSRGMNLEFKRYYNSRDDYDGPLGVGWSHSYNIFLIEASDGENSYVIRRNPDGNKDTFTKNTDGSYSPPPGIFDMLFKDYQGYYIATKTGTIYRFNTRGYLSSITDRNLNSINLTYDPLGKLTKITDTTGREAILTYTPENKISTVIDSTGRTWRYDYENDDLASVTTPPTIDSPLGTTTAYSYQNHNLASITDPKGNTYLNIEYDTQDRVDRLTQAQDDIYDFVYTQNLTTLYEPKSNRIDYQLNDDGTVKKKIEYGRGINYETTYEYNSDKLVTKISYHRGNSTLYTYDSRGNLLESRRKPRPGSIEPDIVTTFTYEPRFNFIKRVTDPRGNTTTYYYDYEEASLGDLNGDSITTETKGNLVKITYPQVDGQTPETKFTYNSYGQLLTVTDPNNNITKYEYYPSTGYLYKLTSAFGSLNLVTEFTYDTVGNVRTIKDPKSNTTTFEYDSHNNLTKTISASPFNYSTIYKYDANDNLIQVDRETLDSSNPYQSTYYTYDILDRLQTITDELSNFTTFGYDQNGNRNLVRDAELNSTTYEYDERNLLWKVTDSLGNTTEYTYDENSNLSQIRDSNSNTTSYTYDDFDRLSKTIYPDYSTEEYTYDSGSNLKFRYTPKGQIIYYEYDNLNRLEEKGLLPKGSNPASVIMYAYDAGSRLTDVVDSIGTIHYEYDSANRVKEVTYNLSLLTYNLKYDYDSNSNRNKLTYPDLSYITYEYDELNRLTYIKDQSNQTIAHYQYDALSRRKQLDLANSTQTTYEYDAINRLTKLANRQTGQQVNFSEYNYPLYDKVGNRLRSSSLRAAEGGEAISNYTYDKIYQLKTVDYPASSSFSDTTYNYDSVGNRTSTVNGGTTTYTPNNLNQYTQVGTTNYTYDSNGNLTSDSTFTYTYDYENRLTSATKSGTSATYKYDPFGRRIEKNVNGAITKFLYDGDEIIAEYDADNNLTAKYINGASIDETIRMDRGANSYYYHYDGLGSVTNLTDASGAIAESYIYDVFGKPNTTSSIGNTRMFTGRDYDAETGLYYYRARYYSPTIGRFLQRDPVGYVAGINLYSYCYNNPVNFIDPLGLTGKKSIKELKDELVDAVKKGDVRRVAEIAIELARRANGTVTITATGALTGTWGPGYMISITADANGNVTIEVGIGLGLGPGGVAITGGGGIGDAGPVSITVTIAGGTGSVGGELTGEIGIEGPAGSLEGGWGVSGGGSITIKGEIDVTDLVKRNKYILY